jgi:D-3-phosphoglycerate dehydrogenase
MASDVEMKDVDKPKVLIADKLSAFVIQELQKWCDLVIDSNSKGEALIKKISEINPSIIIVRSTEITKDHIKVAKDLALIIRAGAGVNNIDVVESSLRGIYVANCPGQNSIAVAELTIGHLINLDRRITNNNIDIWNNKWNKKEYGKANGLCGRTLGLLGCGQIGRQVVKRALSFNMNVKVWDIAVTPEQAKEMGVIYCATPEDCCKKSDAISIHLPLIIPDTKYLVNSKLLNLLNDGAYVINTSRGGLINEQDLLEAIQLKNLRCALDVYENEPEANDKEFKDKNISSCPNIYGTHHIGASTEQAEEAVGRETIHIVKSFLTKGFVPNCVNLEVNSPAKYLLTVRHADVVGVLALILQTLRSEGINVQEMENVVFQGAKAASARLQVDAKPSEKALQTLNANDHIFSVHVVQKKTGK